MFKKTTLAVLGLTVSSMAAAGTMGPVCTPGNVSVPCENRAWDIGIDALYLQPTLGTELAYYGSSTTDVLTWQAYDEWDWGFKLEGSYHFGTGKDLTLDWYHLKANHSYFIPVVNSTSAVEMKWDAVNLELAQFVDVSANKKIRFHGGLAYGRVSSENIDYTAGVIDYTTSTWRTHFSGFGPRTGVDLNYVFGNGFGIYSKAAAALLVGTGDYFTYTGTVNDIQTGKRNPLVPELDAKLGAKYAYNMAQGDLTLDAGWMWVSYLQAQHRSFDGCDGNFNLSGPYIGLNYVGNL